MQSKLKGDSTNAGGSALKDHLTNKRPAFDSNAPYWTFLRQVHDSAWREEWFGRFMRPGFFLILVFEGAIIATSFSMSPTTMRRALPFELFNAVAAFACLAFMWSVGFKQHWRAFVFVFCWIILLSATCLSLYTGRTEPLFGSVMLLLIASGSLVPWSPAWQLAFTLLCLAWVVMNAILLPTSNPDAFYLWLCLLAAAGLAQVSTARSNYQRRELESRGRVLGELPGQ